MAIPVSRTPGAKASGTTAAVSVPLPANIAVGDITILVAETDPTGTVTITVTGGGTWTAFVDTPVTVASGSRLYVWWRRHASGNTAPSVQANVDHVCAGCTAYGGCISSGDPVDVSAVGTEVASDTTFQFITDLTSGGADRICICICTSSADSNTGQFTAMTNALLSNMAEKMDYETTSGHGGGFAFDEGGLAVAGSVGTFAATLSAAWPKAYIAFALKPPALVQFSGSAEGLSSASGSPHIDRKLVGSSAAVSQASGSPQLARKLVGSAQPVSTAEVTTALARRLTGIAMGVSSGMAALTLGEGEVHAYLVGSALSGSSASCLTTVARRLVGTVAAVSSANGVVRLKRLLAGLAAGASTVTVTAHVERRFTGSVESTLEADGTVQVSRQLSGVAEGQSVSTMTPTVVRRFVGVASTVSGAGVAMRVVRVLSGVAMSILTGAATLHVGAAGQVLLSGLAVAMSAVSGTLTTSRRLSGLAVGTSETSGVLQVVGQWLNFAGAAAAGSTVSATLLLHRCLQGATNFTSVATARLRVLASTSPSPVVPEHTYRLRGESTYRVDKSTRTYSLAGGPRTYGVD